VQFLHRVAQPRVVGAVGRVDSREDHRLDFFEARQRGCGGLGRLREGVRERVAHLGVVHAANVAGEKTDLAGSYLLEHDGKGLKRTELGDFELSAVRHELRFFALPDRAVDDANHDHGAAVGVEPAVEDERAKWTGRVTFWSRHLEDNLLKNLLHARAGLAAAGDRLCAVEAHDLFDLFARSLNIG
jgi:hypothetical protein